MNPEDFEQELSRRPLRPLPIDWRAEILAASRSSVPAENRTSKVPARDPFLVTLWRELFWAGRRVWLGFACIWLFIIVANYANTDTPRAMASGPPPSRQQILAIQSQRQLLLQLLDQEPPSKSAAPGRRSERNSRITFG